MVFALAFTGSNWKYDSYTYNLRMDIAIDGSKDPFIVDGSSSPKCRA